MSYFEIIWTIIYVFTGKFIVYYLYFIMMMDTQMMFKMLILEDFNVFIDR